jgi:hypothetical protein
MTTWISVFFAALVVLGMAWRREAMWNWPDTVAVPIIAILLLLAVGAPFFAVATLFAKARTGTIVSLAMASLYVALNWIFADW